MCADKTSFCVRREYINALFCFFKLFDELSFFLDNLYQVFLRKQCYFNSSDNYKSTHIKHHKEQNFHMNVIKELLQNKNRTTRIFITFITLLGIIFRQLNTIFITASCSFLNHIKFVCQKVRETNDDKNKHDYSSAKLQQRKVPLTKQMHFHSVTFAKLKFRIASANIRTNFIFIFVNRMVG